MPCISCYRKDTNVEFEFREETRMCFERGWWPMRWDILGLFKVPLIISEVRIWNVRCQMSAVLPWQRNQQHNIYYIWMLEQQWWLLAEAWGSLCHCLRWKTVIWRRWRVDDVWLCVMRMRGDVMFSSSMQDSSSILDTQRNHIQSPEFFGLKDKTNFLNLSMPA